MASRVCRPSNPASAATRGGTTEIRSAGTTSSSNSRRRGDRDARTTETVAIIRVRSAGPGTRDLFSGQPVLQRRDGRGGILGEGLHGAYGRNATGKGCNAGDATGN